jgi:putative phosphoesterase
MILVRIGLISDTHIPEAQPALWPQVFEAFQGVEAILHAGDIHDLGVIDALERVAPTFAARGNGDDGSGGRPVQPDDPRLREAWEVELGGLRIGLMHVAPIPAIGEYTLERALMRHFGHVDLDVLVYGDTHVEAIDTVDGILCVNPGSPTFPRNYWTSLGTIGFLDVEDGKFEASIWQLTEDGIAAFDWSKWRRPW